MNADPACQPATNCVRQRRRKEILFVVVLNIGKLNKNTMILLCVHQHFSVGMNLFVTHPKVSFDISLAINQSIKFILHCVFLKIDSFKSFVKQFRSPLPPLK